jgi:protease-4
MQTNNQPSFLTRVLLGLWHTINTTRKLVLNLVFFFILLFVIAAMVQQKGGPMVFSDTALVLNPYGLVVEQYSTDATERAINQMMDQEAPEIRMRDLLRAIESAREDSRISRIVINPDRMWGIGLSKLQELRAALDAFKDSGKQVIAYSHGMGQHQYYLASLADEIWLHPEGLVFLEGYSVYRNYYKEGLDKLEVDVHLFKVGEFKSAAEPYVRNDMSEASRESNQYWMGSLWGDFLDDVATQRGMTAEELSANISEFSERLREAGGDGAQAALNHGLVDRLATRDELRAHLIELGSYDADIESFRQIGLGAYVESIDSGLQNPVADKVAVIVAQGIIVGGDQPSGTVGGESTSRLIRSAVLDDQVKAIVLRVDSPGGGVLASEMIRRELEVAGSTGLPIVVSMSSVAASGGYWISMAADEIWANPGTITGSIGIFGMMTNFPKTLAKIGIHTDGVGTTPLAGAFRADRSLPEHVGEIIQQIIDDGYEKFIAKVADSRGMTPEEVDRVARGRVWSGSQAHDRGLVDQLGGLDDAIRSAAEKAGLTGDYLVDYVEKEPTEFESFLLDLTARFPSVLSPSTGQSWLEILARQPMASDIQLLLNQGNNRLGTYAYCFCSIE